LQYLGLLTLFLLLPAMADTVADGNEGDNASVEVYLAALAEAQSSAGAFDENIADIYTGLGNAFLQERNFDKARDAYHRGMHIERVNKGLYDLAQVPYLQRLREVAKAQDDWRAAADYQQQSYSIQQRNFEKGDSTLSSALLDLVDVHLAAYSQIRGFKDGYRHLEKAYAIGISQLIDHLPDPGEQLDDYLALRERSVVMNYEMALLNTNANEQVPTFVNRSGRSDENDYKNLANYYLNGRQDLIRMIEVLEAHGDDPVRVAKAYTDLADWYLLFNKTNSAMKQYRLAYQTGSNHAASEPQITAMFANPVILPRYGLQGAARSKQKTHRLHYSVTVSKYGKAQAITLMQDSEGIPVSSLRRGRAYLRTVRFRPYWVDNEPTRKENHQVLVYVK